MAFFQPKKKSTSSKFIGIRIQKFEVNYIMFELYTLFRNFQYKKKIILTAQFTYRTPLKNGKPINVTLDLVIENVETFDDIKQELELTMVLR